MKKNIVLLCAAFCFSSALISMEHARPEYVNPECSETLDEVYRVYLTRWINYLLEEGKITDNDTVLYLGCGKGFVPGILIAPLVKKVIAIDADQESIEYACKAYEDKIQERKIEFKHVAPADLEPFKNENINVVMSFFCFTGISDALSKLIIEEVKNILPKGGLCILSFAREPYDCRLSYAESVRQTEEYKKMFKALGFETLCEEYKSVKCINYALSKPVEYENLANVFTFVLEKTGDAEKSGGMEAFGWKIF